MELNDKMNVQEGTAVNEPSAEQQQERTVSKANKSKLMSSQALSTKRDSLNPVQTMQNQDFTSQSELLSSLTEWSYCPWSQVNAWETQPPIISCSTSTSAFPDMAWSPSYQPYNSTSGPFVNPGAFTEYNNEGNIVDGLPQNDKTYTRLNSVDELADFDYELGDEMVDTKHSHETSPRLESSASPLTSMADLQKPAEHQHPSLTRRTRQPAWGHSRSLTNSSSTSVAKRSHPHKRRNSTEKPHISSTTTTTNSPAKIPRLITRSTHTSYSSSSIKSPSPPPPPATSPPNTSRARTNHNEVEKQYRSRLNSQFESLLSALPAEEVRHHRGEDREGADAKRVSKAEVLVLAEKYIKKLEKEKMELRSENEELKEKVGELREKWVESGRVVIP